MRRRRRCARTKMRMLLAALLIGHGAAHVVGFAVPWKLVSSAEVPYRTTVLAGAVDVGALGVRLIGVLWLMVALAFVGAAVGLLQHTTWWYREVLVLIPRTVPAGLAGVASRSRCERRGCGPVDRWWRPGLVYERRRGRGSRVSYVALNKGSATSLTRGPSVR